MSIAWGSVPDWLAGAGAVTALIFARTAAISAARASHLQAEQIDKLEIENRRREQRERLSSASKVAVYIGIDNNGDAASPVVRFVNSGDLPIFGLTVSCFTPSTIVERRYFVNGPHHERRTMTALTERLTEMFRDTDPRPLVGRGQLVAACSFTDAAGVSWYRTPHGELHEAEDNEVALASARASGPIPSLPVERIEE